MSDMRSNDDRRKTERRLEQKPKNEPIAVERREQDQRSGEERRS